METVIGSRTASTDAAPTVDADEDRLIWLVASVGATVAIAVWWTLRLTQGFVVDETLTAWITSDGLDDAWTRTYEFQGNSPVYFCLLWFWRQLVGSSELALRLPSVVAVLAAARIVYSMGRELRDRTTGAVAAFVLVSAANIVMRASTARPYGLQILLVTISTWALLRWSQRHRRSDAITWILTGVAAIYMQPFAMLIFAAHGVHLLAVRRRHDGPPSGHLLGLAVVAAAAAAPLVPQLWDIARRSESLVITTQPDVGDLVAVFAPLTAVGALALGTLVARRWQGGLDLTDTRHVAVVAWAAVPATLMFAASHLTGRSVWVARYLAFVTPGVALGIALVLAGVGTLNGRRVAVAALVAFTLFDLGGFAARTDQDWREAVEWGESQVGDRDAEYLIVPALIESADGRLVADDRWRDYFSTPVLHYAPGRRATPLPLDVIGPDAALFDSILHDVTAGADTVVLVARTDSVAEVDYIDLVSRRLDEQGWTVRPGPELHRVGVVVYER